MNGSDGRRVTISTIAREAGVSIPTVSRVLNGRSDVAPGTRERVDELLRRHGYRRRGAPARSEAGLIDLVFNDLDSPWAVEIIRGAEMAAQEGGVGTVVSAVHGDATATQQWLRNLRGRTSDGVVVVNSEVAGGIQVELQRLDVPLVVVDPTGGAEGDVRTIGATNWAGGMAATTHLLSLGHERLGCVAGPARLMCSRARLDGFRAALERAGLDWDEDLVQQGDFSHESGFSCGQALLAAGRHPTGIVVGSDQMAFGVYEALRRRGLQVPDDVSVVGFDDLPQAQWASPPLTTVRQPLSEMGAIAARSVLALARGAQPDVPARMELSTELVVRDSTAPAPN
ncbi:LacI family DNA-binding transcriptional regulator [Lipingzhangella sp. LS1_29]|uniref:LacI family DNA-binding transcriptional regulator n=1 Tax=Lipingzhangella rawalii TaxID=2055835 RepID=A0ABU2H0L4_9ACTN|nr:LacI family DNA-binding transcriptional regulator [Lipingzhangella rawalii]MDS1268844.1 LacI family DNA-binding transcriptional regulator [Lipingzhangella rawalii]